MNNLNTFEECCNFLNIPTDLPKCHIREKQFQATYKLSVCMAAWNKEDEFEPDERANCLQTQGGYAPYLYIDEGKVQPAHFASSGAVSGVIRINADPGGAFSTSNFGIRIVLSTEKQAVAFSRVFIDIFNELI